MVPTSSSPPKIYVKIIWKAYLCFYLIRFIYRPDCQRVQLSNDEDELSTNDDDNGQDDNDDDLCCSMIW